jgi:hypothetical protein
VPGGSKPSNTQLASWQSPPFAEGLGQLRIELSFCQQGLHYGTIASPQSDWRDFGWGEEPHGKNLTESHHKDTSFARAAR